MDERTRRRRYERLYVGIAALFAVLMVLTNVIGTKLFALFPDLLPQGFGPLTSYGPVILTTGLLTYPLTFLFTDVASEIFGHKRANIMVVLGFLSSLLMLAVVHIAIAVPPADRYWSDASGHVIGGAVIEGVSSDGVVVDDASAFARDGGLVAILTPDGPRFGAVTSVERTNGAVTNGYARWVVHDPSFPDLAPGDVLVPALRLADVRTVDTHSARVRLQPAVGLPRSGVLANNAGARFAYDQLDDGGWAVVRPHWQQRAGVSAAVADLSTGMAVAPSDRHIRDAMAMQHAFHATFAAPGILLVASMAAYLVAQLLDVSLFHFWRRLTHGRHLWLRNNGSTFISQLVDTIIVNGIFLPVAFDMGFTATLQVIICVYIVKMMMALLDTPLIYLGVFACKRHLGFTWQQEVPDLLNAEGQDEV